MRKLRIKEFPTDSESALKYMHDAVGVRAVYAFNDDVYRVANRVGEQKEVSLIKTNDKNNAGAST